MHYISAIASQYILFTRYIHILSVSICAYYRYFNYAVGCAQIPIHEGFFHDFIERKKLNIVWELRLEETKKNVEEYSINSTSKIYWESFDMQECKQSTSPMEQTIIHMYEKEN